MRWCVYIFVNIEDNELAVSKLKAILGKHQEASKSSQLLQLSLCVTNSFMSIFYPL